MNIKTEFKKINDSKIARRVLYSLGIAIIGLAIFHAGILVGYHRDRYNARFGENFTRNFRGDTRGDSFVGGGFGGMMNGSHMMQGGHGALGEIVSIALPQIIVSGPDKLEKIIVVNNTTEVREFRTTVPVSSLKVGDSIVAIGVPNETGQIEARLIRRMTFGTPLTASTTTQ